MPRPAQIFEKLVEQGVPGLNEVGGVEVETLNCVANVGANTASNVVGVVGVARAHVAVLAAAPAVATSGVAPHPGTVLQLPAPTFSLKATLPVGGLVAPVEVSVTLAASSCSAVVEGSAVIFSTVVVADAFTSNVSDFELAWLVPPLSV